jgi:AraC-like DNA-binding protein
VSREIRLHGELYMIGNRIHRLFEENEDVTRRMNKYSGELLDKFFFDLINGQTAGRTTYDILDKIGFKQGEYLCCCLMISYNEQFYHEFTEEDGLLIQSKLKNVLQGILSEHVNGYLMELDHHLYVYVVNLSGEEERVNLRRALDNVLTTFEYDMVFCSVTIGVGKPYSQITDMDKSVNDALTAIDIQMANETTTILDASELDIKQTYYFSFLDEIKMINGLKAGDMDEVRSNVERIIHFNRKNGISWHYLGHLLVMLFNSGYRYFIERNTRATPVISEEQYAVLTDKNILPIDYKDRIQLLYAFFEAVISETVTKPEQKSSLMMKRITSYIEENYDKDLHLELISSEMGMSSKYISSFFKEMTGTNITEYVSLVRITAAKQLLLQTDLKITEIAERVGIFSRTTFLRNFKKHEGISPLEYVKANSSKLDGTVPQD